MFSYCCSSSEFLSISLHCSPIQFLLHLSCTSWCYFSLPCIFQILQAQIFSSSVLSCCYTDQEFLMTVRDANFPHIITRKISNTLGSFSLSEVKHESCGTSGTSRRQLATLLRAPSEIKAIEVYSTLGRLALLGTSLFDTWSCHLMPRMERKQRW